MANKACMFPLAGAFSAACLLCLSAPGFGQSAAIQGTWRDQDKSHISDDSGGSGWLSNYFQDQPPQNGYHDPGEPCSEDPSNPTNWIYADDYSCGLAAGANLTSYVSSVNKYQHWAYDAGFNGWSGNPWLGRLGRHLCTWDDQVWTDWVLEEEAYPHVVVHDAQVSLAYWWDIDPVEWTYARVSQSLPVAISVQDQSSAVSTHHALTVYAVDLANHTITIADSDKDKNNSDFSSYAYDFDGSHWTLHNYGGADYNIRYCTSFATNTWQGAGTGGDTSTTGPTTVWANPANWSTATVPRAKDFPTVEMGNGGAVNIEASASAAQTLIDGFPCTVRLPATGSLSTYRLLNRTGHIRLTGGTITATEFTNDYVISGYGTVNARLENEGSITPDSGTLVLNDDLYNDGTVTVNGTGTALASAGEFLVGWRGEGIMAVTQGGEVSSHYGHIGETSPASGVASIDGDGSRWKLSNAIYIGVCGGGSLNITGGATVNNDRWGVIGDDPGSTGAVIVDGSSSVWSNGGSLYVGYEGDGMLDVTAAGQVTSHGGYIARRSGSTGTVTVRGTGSAWTDDWKLYIGKGGEGTLNIRQGGHVTSKAGCIGVGSGSTGRAAVNGMGSTWVLSGNDYWCGELTIADSGDGTLDITDGGTVSNDASTWIGGSFGSTGSATVDGADSTWTIGQGLIVGGQGDGSLHIAGGGTVTVSNGYARIGYESDSAGVVSVDGAGSAWTNNDTLYIGDRGVGALSITGGGTVTNIDPGGDTYVGYHSGATGAVTVDGSGSTWSSADDLWIGYNGDGTVDISRGAEVVVAGDTRVSDRPDSSGKLTFDNGTLTTHSLVCPVDSIAGSGTINVHGLVTDVDLVFDAAHGLNQTVIINPNPGQDIMVNLDVDGSGILGVGYSGHNTMTVSDGLAVESTHGYIGYDAGSTGMVTVEGTGSAWTCSEGLRVGNRGSGTLVITDGGVVVSNEWTTIGGASSDSAAAVTVSGRGSGWTTSGYFYIGGSGGARLEVTDGGVVTHTSGGRFEDIYIGRSPGSAGDVTIRGPGSRLVDWNYLYVGDQGKGTLTITGGGLARVADTLIIDWDGDGDSFVNMSAGGMLALKGDADSSLHDFLDLILGTDALRYWNGESAEWDLITHATRGEDYDLGYVTSGDLAGYTVITVPEPATLALLTMGGMALLAGARKKKE